MFTLGGDMMLFNEKLKSLRQSKNLTQEEFANTLGVSRVHVTSLESGRVKPTQLLLNCISLAYNIDKDWLVDEHNEDLSCLNSSDILLKEIVENYEVSVDNEDSEGLIKIVFESTNSTSVEKTFNKVEISPIGSTLFNAIEEIVDEYGDSVDDNEKRNILMDILSKYI